MSDACNPMDCSPQGSSVCGILQARILECHFQWVAISSPGTLPFRRDQTSITGIAGRFFTSKPPGKPRHCYYSHFIETEEIGDLSELDPTPGSVTVESVPLTTPLTASDEKECVSVTHQVTSVPRNVILQIAGNVLKVLSPSISL